MFEKKIKSNCCVFDNQRIKLAKNAKFYLQSTLNGSWSWISPFSVYKDCVSGVWVSTSCKFNQSGLKKLISCCFWWKSLNFVKLLAGIWDKKNQWNQPTMYFVFKRKINNIFIKNLIKVIKIGKILVENSERRWMKSTEFSLFSRKFKPRYLPVKNENHKNLFNSIFYAEQAF